MRWWLAIGLGLFLLAVFAGCSPRPAAAPEPVQGPPGSLVHGVVCFVHWTPDGWQRIGLVDEHGRAPARDSVFKGRWFFPLDAGPVAIEACKWE